MPNPHHLSPETALNPNIQQSFVPEGELNSALNAGYISRSSNSPAPPSPLSDRPRFDFFLERGDYTQRETLKAQGWVEYEKGIASLDRIDFQIRINDTHIIDVIDVDDFVVDPYNSQRGTFSYDLNLQDLSLVASEGYSNYQITLEGSLYNDKSEGYRLERSFSLSNHRPTLEMFGPKEPRPYSPFYNSRETIEFVGSIRDLDGQEDIDRVQIRASFKTNSSSYNTTDFTDITNFAFNPYTSNADFTYHLDLKTIAKKLHHPWQPAENFDFKIDTVVFDKAGNQNFYIPQEFEFFVINSTPSVDVKLVEFYENTWLPTNRYALGDTLTIHGTVADENGLEDIEKVKIFLAGENLNYNINDRFDLTDIIDFIPDTGSWDWNIQDHKRGTFEYTIDLKSNPKLFAFLKNPNLTSFSIESQILDKTEISTWTNGPVLQGWGSGKIYLSNNTPIFGFSLNKTQYDVGETAIVDIGVTEWDSIQNLDRINFQIHALDENQEVIAKIDIADVTAFPGDPRNTFSSFEHHIDLGSLKFPIATKAFHLVGTLLDKAENHHTQTSQIFNITNFLTTPNSTPSVYFARRYDYPSLNSWETITIEGTVRDIDGLDDIDRLSFELFEGFEKIADLDPITQFNPNPNNNLEGTFSYNLDFSRFPLSSYPNGPLYLKTKLWDKAGYFHELPENLFSQGSYPYFHVYREMPSVDFEIDKYDPTPLDTISLENAKIYYEQGVKNIERIDFKARVMDRIVDLPDPTHFKSAAEDVKELAFTYHVEMKDLLPYENFNGFYSSIFADVYDKSGNKIRFSRDFIPENFGAQVNFDLERYSYNASETLKLGGAREITYPYGISNIDRLDFKMEVVNSSFSKIIDLDDVTTFDPDLNSPDRDTFEYNIDLKSLNLPIGTNEVFLVGKIYNTIGQSWDFPDRYSHPRSIRISNTLPWLSFNLDRTSYFKDEILSLNNSFVTDGDGLDEIDFIDFRLRIGSNQIIDLADVNTFIADPNDANKGIFNYTVDLSTLGLSPGTHELFLEGTVYDKTGNTYRAYEQRFELTNNIPALNFWLSQSEYQQDDILTFSEKWVEDSDGFANLDRIAFLLRNLDSGEAIDVPDVTDLIAHPNNSQRGLFNYSLNLKDWGLNAGNYELEGIAYDRQNNASLARQKLFEILPPGNAPQDLHFSLDRNTYTSNDTIALNNGWVKDEDGGDDITRIDLHLLDAHNNLIADLNEITHFTIASWNNQWTSFNTQIDLIPFNLDRGTYRILGIAYDANNNASSAFDRNFYLDIPQNQFNPSNLQFNLDKNSYKTTDTLKINNGWISDGDGSDDLNRVEFKLVNQSGAEIILDAIDRFDQASWSPEWASFNHRFDLSQLSLDAGKYTLIGIAYDSAGQQSNHFERSLNIEIPQVNTQAPIGLQFRLNNNSFTTNDTIEIMNGWVSDSDGHQDLEGIDFELIAENGTIIDVSHNFDFTAATWDFTQQWSSFSHRINLNGLGLNGGRYTLRGKAYDRAGNYSDAFSRMFAIAP